MRRPRPKQRTDEKPLLRPIGDRVEAVSSLLAKIYPVPREWLNGAATGSDGHIVKPGGSKAPIELLKCETFRELRAAWRRALRWTPGLEHGLTVMLASVASTMTVGDQLWCKIIGPASCGKSCLCEALSTNKEYVYAKSTIRGFHSGYSIDGGDDEDHSLLVLISGKTLVTKDGDTLLQSPELPRILAEARDIYDGTSRTHYRNSKSKDYEGVRTTWLLCGTSSLRSIDNSELGERFLDCVIMDEIDDELEDEILRRVVDRAEAMQIIDPDEGIIGHQDPDMGRAMQLTGGYVEWLRENADEGLSAIDFLRESKDLCMSLGKFVAYMRARPSHCQEEIAEREFSARLVIQLVRLGKCLALVLNRKSVDGLVMNRVRQVALDTSRGDVLNITEHLRDTVDGGTVDGIAVQAVMPKQKVRRLLLFSQQIGIAETFSPPKKKGMLVKKKWRLTERFQELYDSVMG